MTEKHICCGKKMIPEGLSNHLLKVKNVDIFHRATHYYLMKLELLWNQHKKVATLRDTKRHSSSHTRKHSDNNNCDRQSLPPPYSRHSELISPTTRCSWSHKSTNNKRNCRSPEKFKSRRRVDSGRGNVPASSVYGTTRAITRSLTINEKSSKGGSDREQKKLMNHRWH